MNTPSLDAKEHGKHNACEEVAPEILGDISEKVIVGGIRNPWDWYVSMWAFGCMGKGRFRQNVEELPLELRGWAEVVVRNPGFLNPTVRKEWQEVYADSTDPALFRRWLKRVYDRRRMNDSREGFKQSPISSFGGLLLYRYLRLYTAGFIKNRNTISTPEEVLKYDLDNNLVDQMIRTERINDGIRRLYTTLDIDPEETESVLKAHDRPTNTSSRGGYADYYDEESQALVAEREAYLIKKYDYTF